MRLDTEFYKLPLKFDVQRLTEEVLQFSEEDWRAHPQGHANNSAIALISVGGNPASDSVKGPMRGTPFLERCPYIQQVFATFGTVLGRARLMRIGGEADATEHVDTNYYWLKHTRVHVPAVTFPEVQFYCNKKSLHMAAGETWIFDTFRMHNVINPVPKPRIHVVVDTTGSPAFWDLVGQAERPFDPRPGAAAARFVPYEPGKRVTLEYEQHNFPVVMSPEEQVQMFTLVMEELRAGHAPADSMQPLQTVFQNFNQQWKTLWAQHADRRTGWPAYEQALAEFDRNLQQFAQLRLPNGIEAIEIIRQGIVRAGMTPELAGGTRQGVTLSSAGPATISPAAPAAVPPPSTVPATAAAPAPAASAPRTQFDRPVFIVAAPRSGSTLLFETLSRSPGAYTPGGESHQLFERIPAFNPAHRRFDSNRLTAADALPEAVNQLRSNFIMSLRDRANVPPPAANVPLRMLEKTPKNALRIPFLDTVFPGALFIYLFREPRGNISSIMDAWRSEKFVTYPKLPQWNGPKWSLALTPGWRDLNGKSLGEIAAAQWSVVNQTILDDLQALPQERWCAVSYEDFLAKPQETAERLCSFAGLPWDVQLPEKLPLSRHTLTPPDPEKWKRNAAELEQVLPKVEFLAARAREAVQRSKTVLASLPSTVQAPLTPAGALPAPVARGARQGGAGVPLSQQPLKCVATSNFANLLAQLKTTLLVSTYQAGKLIIVRNDNGGLNTHFRNFQAPMGIAASGNKLALGTSTQVWQFVNQPDVGKKLNPPGKHDHCYMPRNVQFTGDIRIHEIAYSGDELWLVNTRFSCLCTLDSKYSFVPRWRPNFITGLAPEDRCHLNGLAFRDGKPKYVTALGRTDTQGGWRENKKDGGILIDVDTNEIIATGLSMPHSPRWHNGKLWILESGHGRISYMDPQTGKFQTVAELPGFTRGLDFIGPFAIVGLSQVRETAVFSGIPITEQSKERVCGVWVVDLRNGQVASFLRFDSGVQEIFAVQALPGMLFPDVVNDSQELIGNSFILPDEALAQVRFSPPPPPAKAPASM